MQKKEEVIGVFQNPIILIINYPGAEDTRTTIHFRKSIANMSIEEKLMLNIMQGNLFLKKDKEQEQQQEEEEEKEIEKSCCVYNMMVYIFLNKGLDFENEMDFNKNMKRFFPDNKDFDVKHIDWTQWLSSNGMKDVIETAARGPITIIEVECS